jgi:anti-anti-sigma regulatory factor
METFEKIVTNSSVIINVNLISATLSEANELKNCVDDVILFTDKNVIVDLSMCQHLDSTFIGTLVLGLKKLKQKERELILIEPKDHTKIFLTINRIETIFKMFTSIKDAVKHLEELPVQELETLSDAVPPSEDILPAELNFQKENIEDNIQQDNFSEEFIAEENQLNEEVNNLQEGLYLPETSIENTDEIPVEEEIHDSYDEDDYRHGTVEWAFGFTK